MPKDSRVASKRPYGNACQPCRKKKIGCDGRRPACGQCCKVSETCEYIRSVRELRPGSDLMELRLDRLERLLGLNPLESVAGTNTSIHSHQSLTDGLSESDNKDRESSDSAVALRDVQLDGTSYKVRRGGQGELIYYGVTSMPKGDPLPPSRARSPDNNIIRSADDGGFSHSDLPFLQLLATYKHVSVAPEVGNSLLDAFFCYSGPLYNVVDRMLFLRDMALSGPYFSEFLLMALYASGTRMVDGLSEYERKVQGDMFTKRAKELLAQELDGPSKVTTIQGLLVLSGRECAVGQDSQGWLHAGMVSSFPSRQPLNKLRHSA
ncbi:hypothetical protein BCR39DRAFT_180801 [Naematelia encephala]|uniref:Zn(2)-C6 fungal-type domain-containing protein n=1 Tax=Naematelia encephala TaxID=71784 RepID=A0A1Y2B385_9TREE|nr:hypothetical protein BCR39DRAFT_180801 [Naematelia encephala]